MSANGFKVHIPLQRVEECYTCKKKAEKLSFCSSCWDRVYCSPECQNRDWKEGGHKKECVKIQRVDLEIIYPFLASLCYLCRSLSVTNPHPGLTHRIINSPNPGITLPEPIPGSSDMEDQAMIVRLGTPVSPQTLATPTWWPTALNEKVRNKMRRRITFDGFDFHLHWVVCFALLDAFYTEQKLRLKYKSHPIADFGLAHGKFRVTCQDRLAYVLPDGTVQRGQDPDDHWWIYFTTMKGEELILDFGVYTWNMAMFIGTEPYVAEPLFMAPAVFFNRMLNRNVPDITSQLYTEKERFSVLKDKDMASAILDYPQLIKAMPMCFKWAENKLKRTLNAEEKSFLPHWIQFMFMRVGDAMNGEQWKTWPELPPRGIDIDPNETLRTQ
ncbi:hypothetical protein FRC01_003967 [Tulasnella sp. 417]|nr:hypothetical protein FRC01_003967 [Tulasnella sp. 417]